MLSDKKILILLAGLSYLSVIGTLCAAPRNLQRQDMTGQQETPFAARQQQLQDRQNQQVEEIQGIGRAVDTDLSKILNLINGSVIPNRQTISSAQSILQQAKKMTPKFDNNLTCQYHTLEAWTQYFSKELEEANAAAAKATRANPQNPDARATQAAIAVLTGQKPAFLKSRSYLPPVSPNQRQDARPRNRRMQNQYPQTTGPMMPMAMMSDTAATSNGILNLDVDGIEPELVGKTISSFDITCINQTTFSYKPENTDLCLLLWQLPEAGPQSSVAVADARGLSGAKQPGFIQQPQPPVRSQEPSSARRPRRRDQVSSPYQPGPQSPQPMMSPEMMLMMQQRGMMQPGYRGQGLSASSSSSSEPEAIIQEEMAAFAELFSSEFDNPEIKFIAVNKNSPGYKNRVVAVLLDNPCPSAHAIADANIGNQFKSAGTKQPLLLITDKTGTIKYAGPATGFLAPMVLAANAKTNLLAIEAVSQSAPADSNSLPAASVPAAGVNRFLRSILPAASNPSANQPAQPAAGQPSGQVSMDDEESHTDDGFTLSRQAQAEKLYYNAEGLFIRAAKRHFLTPRNGIEICRRIIREYADTEYADKARLLLASLSEPDRQQYGITAEETTPAKKAPDPQNP